jgi:hypothetical protein
MLNGISKTLLLLFITSECLIQTGRVDTLSSTEDFLRESHLADFLGPTTMIILITVTNIIGVFSLLALYFTRYYGALILYVIFTHWHTLYYQGSQIMAPNLDSKAPDGRQDVKLLQIASLVFVFVDCFAKSLQLVKPKYRAFYKRPYSTIEVEYRRPN